MYFRHYLFTCYKNLQSRVFQEPLIELYITIARVIEDGPLIAFLESRLYSSNSLGEQKGSVGWPPLEEGPILNEEKHHEALMSLRKLMRLQAFLVSLDKEDKELLGEFFEISVGS